ncbi:DUF885 family protein [Novosphingobium panipatense]|uniref:Uncharacterized conserved protein, DUF885 familyt n=1 Tax=Novosphingobium panipatense TaxID=428991 RepID=A0ABY1QTD4_9SPHN|nr:DUF885 family protein [Novosphingobium panipatense]SMP80427.1 Uncharacterized conserved protein, DUF885 familyt [Novosphingobium panipatense]
MSSVEDVALSIAEADELAREVLGAWGLAPDHAAAVADTMVRGERDGCTSHGLYRLLVAASSVERGVVAPDAVPQVSEPAPALVRVDGGGGFAQLPFERGAPLLIEKAKRFGIAALAINNAVHFAALWPEVEALAEQGLVALAFTPSHAWVAPEGGTRPVFGTNPIAFGWPRPGRPPFVFDFATSAVARGEIELHRRAGKPIPSEWGYDADGRPSTNAEAVLAGAMRTFGAHKGSALAAMVELLAGPLIGDMTSAESLAADEGRGGSPLGGELIVAIDPAGFLGAAVEEHLRRAEAMFGAIEEQGARLPGARRLAARAHSEVAGLRIPRKLHTEILEVLERGKSVKKSLGGAVLLAGAAMAAPMVAVSAPVTSAPAAKVQSADAMFEAISSAEFTWRQNQVGPCEDTPRDAKVSLPDIGREAQAERLACWEKVERQLATIRQEDLSPANRVNFAVYKGQIDALLASQRYRDYEKPFNADTSFWGDLTEWARNPLKDAEAAEAYIEMLRGIPRYYDQQIENMRAGLKRGFTAPHVTLAGRDKGIERVANARTAEESPFYEPLKEMPATIPAAEQERLRAEARTLITQGVVPAHAKLLSFMRGEYEKGARKTLAAYDLPDGKAYYRAKIQEFVTLDKSAEEIHKIGVSEMARIRGRMAAVMAQVGFQGDLKAFLHFLRTDPQFYPKTANELLYRAAWIAKTFDGKADQYFGRLPRSRFAIKPVPDEIAPFYTGGRGGPGIYLVNTYNLPSRPFYSQVALTLHESAPGHAMQMPLAAENKDLPAFRRMTYLSAYGEGWALYSEALGEDMGMYETPYDLFGMLSYQAWRASRLVVDTGIHAFGWSREQAQTYLRENTALSDHEIETEVDRYISWPGQALSYYMGQLAFVNGRAKAEKALGAKFDIRAFHDAMLELGGVPLTVVEQRVDRFIADGGKGPYPDE